MLHIWKVHIVSYPMPKNISNTIQCGLWPKWHFNRFSILATVLHLHSEINWILFGCSSLHVVALIQFVLWQFAFRTIRVLHCAYKGIRNPVLKIMKWKLVGPFLTRHSSLCPKAKNPAVQGQTVVQAINPQVCILTDMMFATYKKEGALRVF